MVAVGVAKNRRRSIYLKATHSWTRNSSPSPSNSIKSFPKRFPCEGMSTSSCRPFRTVFGGMGVEVSMGKCGELCGFDGERWTGTGRGVLTYPALNKHKHCSRSSYPPSKKCSSVCVCFCVFLCIYGVTIFRIFIQKLTSLYALVYGIQLW